MDAIDFLKERDRMCKESSDCKNCPGEGTSHRCMVYLLSDANGVNTATAKRAVEIVEEWAKDHPRKTMLQDFFEKFPNAPKNKEGIPDICPNHCGYIKHEDCIWDDDNEVANCKACWSRPLE